LRLRGCGAGLPADYPYRQSSRGRGADGWPAGSARIPLADAVVLVCNSPKSNSAYNAINAAMADIQKGKSGPVPRSLQNKHFDGEDNANKGQFYEYPHSFDGHWIKQQYLPDVLKNAKYYEYGDNRNEQAAKEYWEKIKNK
jgi:putative ATPase